MEFAIIHQAHIYSELFDQKTLLTSGDRPDPCQAESAGAAPHAVTTVRPAGPDPSPDSSIVIG